MYIIIVSLIEAILDDVYAFLKWIANSFDVGNETYLPNGIAIFILIVMAIYIISLTFDLIKKAVSNV